jgi:hypothetical protein
LFNFMEVNRQYRLQNNHSNQSRKEWSKEKKVSKQGMEKKVRRHGMEKKVRRQGIEKKVRR